jgi:hypothetical protein
MVPPRIASQARHHLHCRRALLIAAPLCWIPVALLHPAPSNDQIYDDLVDVVWRWLGVHFAQLVLSLGLGAALWVVVRGRSGGAATLSRVAVLVWLVSSRRPMLWPASAQALPYATPPR